MRGWGVRAGVVRGLGSGYWCLTMLAGSGCGWLAPIACDPASRAKPADLFRNGVLGNSQHLADCSVGHARTVELYEPTALSLGPYVTSAHALKCPAQYQDDPPVVDALNVPGDAQLGYAQALALPGWT